MVSSSNLIRLTDGIHKIPGSSHKKQEICHVRQPLCEGGLQHKLLAVAEALVMPAEVKLTPCLQK